VAKKPLTLSIVIPVYNEQNHLKACLDAITAQTVKPDEVIVVDNNSTDDSIKIAKSYPFVKLIYEKKPSVLFARNAGFNTAKSDLIGRIDADTVLAADWVKRAKSLMTDPDIFAVTGPVAIYDMPLPRFTRWLHDVLLRVAVKGGYHFLTGSNMVIRKSAWQTVKSELCEDLSIFEDTDLAIHLSRMQMTPSYSPRLWASVSARRFADKRRNFFRYMRRHSQTLKKHNMPTTGAHYAQAAYAITYFLSWPLHRLFDPVARRFTLRRIFKSPARRSDPMDNT